MNIAFLDHLDSFTYNVIALLKKVHPTAKMQVFSPQANLIEIENFQPQWIILGPGPGKPSDYPLLAQVLESFSTSPILGICLGMQAINEYYGGETKRGLPVHGKSSLVHHQKHRIFAGIPSPFSCMRYHSLHVVAKTPVKVIAEVEGVPMALQVSDKKIFGLQFHPESFASDYGETLLHNIWEASQ